MKKYMKLRELVESIEGDAEKFWNKKNGAAGTRVRKSMQEVKKIAQDIRSEIQDIKNSK